jgi:subtilisin family serine protease
VQFCEEVSMAKTNIITSSAMAVLAIGLFGGVAAQPVLEDGKAPILKMEGAKIVPDQYIVVMKKGAQVSSEVMRDRAKALGGEILYEYRAALNGFSIRIAPDGLAKLRELPGIDYIEPDVENILFTAQTPAVPGLDRSSERLLPLDNTYNFSEDGTGVHVYVIDTGIRATNTEFGGRVTGGVTQIMDGNGTNDCQGHGTNVAGIVGGTQFGVAKNVALHPVRVFNCAGGGATTAVVVAAVDWVTTNAVHPAVANMSLGGVLQPALDTAVGNSIASGITYTLAAGNGNVDACTNSPGNVPAGITVGNVNPADDRRRLVSPTNGSNWGPCLDLFAPGVGIQAAGFASDTATSTFSGTSQAAPHVAGTAAKYLQFHTAATPAAIHAVDNVTGTPGWAGIIDPNGSVNELLHWGESSDGQHNGDPHINTVNGVNYDFQSGGEFVALRDGMFELQTRQTPVATASPIFNPHTGLTSCVSVNTAAAVRVGKHRISYQAERGRTGAPLMQVRIDGAATALPPGGINLSGGGHVVSLGGGVLVETPDGAQVSLLPNFWGAPNNIWYLNVGVAHTQATEGTMGAVPTGSWLPRLSDGTSIGPLPGSLAQRQADLHGTFAKSWRVTDATTLFDYATGTSTASFTNRDWPPEGGNCTLGPRPPIIRPVPEAVAQRLCIPVRDKAQNANCVADVVATGNRGFAKAYAVSQRVADGLRRKTRDNR